LLVLSPARGTDAAACPKCIAPAVSSRAVIFERWFAMNGDRPITDEFARMVTRVIDHLGRAEGALRARPRVPPLVRLRALLGSLDEIQRRASEDPGPTGDLRSYALAITVQCRGIERACRDLLALADDAVIVRKPALVTERDPNAEPEIEPETLRPGDGGRE
jgi:hypothetical protein